MSDIKYTSSDRPDPDCVCEACAGRIHHGAPIVWREADDTSWHRGCWPTDAEVIANRLPRKGDRVRFWVLDQLRVQRYRVFALIARRRAGWLYLTIDGQKGERMIRARVMDIIALPTSG